MLDITYNDTKQVFHLTNGRISYLLKVEHEGSVTQVYFGNAIHSYHGIADYPRLNRDFEVNESVEDTGIGDRQFSIGNLLLEYPTYGRGDFRHPAGIFRHADGSTVSDFRYHSYEIIAGKPTLSGLPSTYVVEPSEAKTLYVHLVDELKQLRLTLQYTIFAASDVVVRSAKVSNLGDQTTHILKLASASVDFSPREFELIQLNGTWARERHIEREAVHIGIKVLDSKRGTSSHQQAPYLALVSPTTTEFTGEAYSFQLVYSGNHEMSVEKDPYHQVRIQLGIQSLAFDWVLEPGASFQTPEVVMGYSATGLNTLSQTSHEFVKQHLIPRRFADMERPVLINNWEGTYFDFTEEKLHDLIDEAQALGIELFVLDDGWFGQRDDDTTSLGDWHVHSAKLPNGLSGIADYAHQRGLKFGLWFEPEMISNQSELFKVHPDWAIQTPGRSKTVGRDQYVLDYSREDVRNNIYEQIVAVLDSVEIDYIKWDMNRHLTEVYSLDLPIANQGEVSHRYVLGLYALLERLTQRYPNILFESCSGGGGRFDLGMLAYMPQTWTSDDTDAVERLSIQYGTSLFAPLNTMGAHISAVPNHQTGRITSLPMRAEVAYFGDFGYELDLTAMTEAEKQLVKQQVVFYKQHRRLFQQGVFTRLISPFESNECAWMVSDDTASEALVGYYRVLSHPATPFSVLRIPNLDMQALYRVTSEAQSFEATGAELAHIGFYVSPQLVGDFQSRVYHIVKL